MDSWAESVLSAFAFFILTALGIVCVMLGIGLCSSGSYGLGAVAFCCVPLIAGTGSWLAGL